MKKAKIITILYSLCKICGKEIRFKSIGYKRKGRRTKICRRCQNILTQRRLRRELKVQKEKLEPPKKLRNCLRCDREFMSSGNFLCDSCRKIVDDLYWKIHDYDSPG